VNSDQISHYEHIPSDVGFLFNLDRSGSSAKLRSVPITKIGAASASRS